MKRKRNLKKRIGTSRIGTSCVLLPALFLVALAPLAAAPKKKPALETYAVLSGSVFQANGYALPRAEVMLAPESDKDKKMKTVSDARGEFVLRVPPGPMHYTLRVDAKGYQSQRKIVNIEGQERVEVTFQLERESK